jgi:polyhydroxybutyrate depolymerase
VLPLAVQIRCLLGPGVTSIALLALAAACGGDSSESAPGVEAGVTTPEIEGGAAPVEAGAATPDGAAPDATVSTPAPCKGKAGLAGDKTVTLTSGGKDRTFDLHVPPSYDATKRTPLVFLFHGYTMTAEEIATASHFAAVADKRGMIVAFPQGIGNGFNAGDCCGSAQSSKVDDVGFTRDMIANLDAAYCVDDKRTFATGFSNGGFLSYLLACELSDKIAAVAPVAGGLRVDEANCTPKRPVPLLHVHGTGDVVVPFLGGGLGLAKPVSASIDAFKAKNTCAAGAGQNVYTNGGASCTTWGPCAAGADVELCTIAGGGHQWPGGDTLPYGGIASPDLDTSQVIADFFAAHPMP